jgi:hypothetical protein
VAELRRIANGPAATSRPGRNWTKADVRFFDTGAERFAVKDYGPRSWFVRQTLGRLLISREAAAYRAAAGVPGLPRFLGRLGPFRLATEWIDAAPLAERGRDTAAPECFDRLDEIVAELHRRGVALGDLHHRDVLVDGGGGVHVVDLATAWVLGSRPSGWRRRIFERLRDQDRVAAARIRARFLGGDVDRAVEEVGGVAAARYRRARWLKAVWDRVRGRGGR